MRAVGGGRASRAHHVQQERSARLRHVAQPARHEATPLPGGSFLQLRRSPPRARQRQRASAPADA
eukprot:8156039-Heterocapsa_arctica.AAC.1